MKTTCEHCIFAEKDNLVQIGCELGYLDKFKNLNLVEKVDNHYEIGQGVCPGCRNIYWLEKHKKEEIYQELNLQYSAIILVEDDNFEDQIDVFYNLDVKPKEIIVSLISSDIIKSQELLPKLSQKYPLIRFIVTNFLSEHSDKQRVKSAVSKIRTPYFICVKGFCEDLSIINLENKKHLELMSGSVFIVSEKFFYSNKILYKCFYDCENPVEEIVKYIGKQIES